MSVAVTNMVTYLRAEVFRNTTDRYITSAISPEGRTVTTKEGRSVEFRDYFENFFVRGPVKVWPSSTTIWLTSSESRISEEQIHEALKRVTKDKTPVIDELPYEVNLRPSSMLVLLLPMIFNHWMEQVSIFQPFTRRLGL